MTRKNILSLLTAGVMGISCFSMNVSAESAYAVGDVDMDDIVTGHDTAMVSRYLLEEDYTLTEEQLSLADVDGDGEVTQADADKLYNEMQVYHLGAVVQTDDRDRSKFTGIMLDDVSEILRYYAHTAVQLDYEFTDVQKNLTDLNLDGEIDTTDAMYTALMYAKCTADFDWVFLEPNAYYFPE